MNKRLQHIDTARGIGILLIVFGHMFFWEGNYMNNIKLSQVIYSFHLPLFFFLSGLFFKPELRLKSTSMHKADSLLKPYFIVLIVLLVLKIVNHGSYPLGTVLQGIFGYFLAAIYGIERTLPTDWGSLWFLPHLWAIFIFSYIFVRVLGYEKRPAIIKIIFLGALLLFGYFTIGLYGKLNLHYAGLTLNGLPFSIEIVCLTAFYFLCGFTMREKVMTVNNTKHNGLFLFITTLFFFSLHYFFNYRIDLNERVYDNFFICTTEALCGIYITITISRIISKSEELANVLAFIGKGSLFILIFHGVVATSVYSYLHNVIKFRQFFSACVAFPVAVCVPLLLWEIVKRDYYLSLLLLPLKSNKKLQTAGEEKGL